MEEASKLKSLFEAWDRLSDRGRGHLLAYGHGLADMEAMIIAEQSGKNKTDTGGGNPAAQKGGKTA